ncbi:DUF456 domain-containing protein [Ornithinimicrobium faecis]|uniref:DUF456 domain-containing protein n=1 Tax=Ornithinimicrobium faecis TaxID=2934158 RepID=A0ABY4YZK0_9MICO|nr:MULTISPECIES: DUF456 domain-containing protein [unclassified Ornithinimicrobium]USQ81710.1 DUF456 domain-containing protein [Ornithinimicrobium sp. HY1793]
MSVVEWIVAAVMLVGLLGIVIPVLPGLLLIVVGVAVWATELQTSAGWWVLGLTIALYAACLVLEFLIPGKRMKAAGVKTSTLLIGVLVAIPCAIVIPVLGAFIGFPLGIFLVELSRRGGRDQAWAATKHALKAVGLNILIEFLTAVVIIGLWVAALIFWT